MIKVGLTFGKYAPLHRGHCHVINTALEQVDELFIIVYDATWVTEIPLRVRSNWIRKIFKENADRIRIIEGYGAPQDCGLTDDTIKLQNDYIKKCLDGRKITHVFTSELYGEYVTKALGAENVQVDPKRELYQINATVIRKNAFAYRDFVPPAVYWDLITKVVFLGSESTGKTTLAKECAKHFNTAFVPEYGEEFWHKYNVDGKLTPRDLETIAEHHFTNEETEVMNANKYLFIDTSPLTTWMFSHYYHNMATPKLNEYANVANNRYDLVFVCDTDIPFDDSNGRRSRKENLIQQRILIDELVMRKIRYVTLYGTLQQRIAQVALELDSLPQ